jgi:hypothetical protein
MRNLRIGTLLAFCMAAIETTSAATLTDAQKELEIICSFPKLWPSSFGKPDVVCHSSVLASFTDEEAKEKTKLFWRIYTDKKNKKEDILALPNPEEKMREVRQHRLVEEERIAAEEEKVAAQVQAEKQRARDYPSLDALRSMQLSDLCDLFRRVKSPASLAEIKRRNTFSPSDMGLVSARKISIGMSEPAMLCAWGTPKDRNRTVNAGGVHIQWVYDGTYVYTVNGKITSWQD